MDHTQFSDSGRVKQRTDNRHARWWEQTPREAADSVSQELSLLEKAQAGRIEQYMISARLYGNLPAAGLTGASWTHLLSKRPALRDKVSYNVVQSCVDTAQAKMSKNRPKPYFLTSGGDYRTQRKAKKLNQFTDGVFYENDAYELGIEAFRDGEVFGDGVIHVFAKNNRVAFERVLPSELYVDEEEGRYGRPRKMHRVKQVDRAVLSAYYPGHRSKIENASASTDVYGGSHLNTSDVVTLRQSWHLPSKPGATDGAWIVTIDGEALTPMVPWKNDFFPFARFQWCPPLIGFWGQGGAEQIQNIQFEINKLLWSIQRSFHLGGSFKILKERSSKISPEHLNNDVGTVIEFTGVRPEYITPPMVQPEIFQHLQTLKQSAYEQIGISSMNATSTKPAGLNSGKALREYDDIGTDRFLAVGQRYQKLYLDLAKLSIAVAKEIAEENKGEYEVRVPGSKFLSTVDWSDIDLSEDEYVMQCFPVSSLPSDPAGRLQTIQEYAQAGYITPRQAKRLLNFPDLEQTESLQGAMEDHLTQSIEKMIDEGIQATPDPADDLQLADEIAAEYYAMGLAQGLDEEAMERIRTYRTNIGAMMDMAAAEMAAKQQSIQPQAAPMPQPVSDLVQNVPGAGAPPS